MQKSSFDLRQVDVQRLVAADLRLTVAPTYPEIYHSGEVASWRFELQGMAIDESAIPNPKTMTWNNTRAFSGRPLAEFRLDAVPVVGTEVRVGGEALAEFLQQQAGGRVVLMIRRLTAFRKPNVVHAFASSETGEAGPVLYLQYANEAE